MLENIKFCSCTHLDIDEARESQCMFFSFTERARKILSDEFMYQITDTSSEDNFDKTGIPPEEGEASNGGKPLIKRLEDNYFRIPTQHVHSFVKCLFKYLPAYYVSSKEDREKYSCI
ncbi:hypothetical protein ACFL7D_08470 [candidate division KSB1 bacterium]